MLVREAGSVVLGPPETIVSFERGERLEPQAISVLRAALEASGAEFTEGRAPGVLLRRGVP
jgi:hypothetical protein